MNINAINDYYIGLDIGTNSLGWAVTNDKYEIPKFNGKAMWGVRLFSEAETAANTRDKRTSRRRLSRKKWRMQMLEEMFAEEIAKVDPGFFLRLKESRLQLPEKSESNKQSFNIFADEGYTDAEYHADYPTIYHLRKTLIENNGPFDVRLVFLALQHIIKRRGHFLFDGISADNVTDFESVFAKLKGYIQLELGLEDWECKSVVDLEALLKDKTKGIKEKQRIIKYLLPLDSAQEKAIADLLIGAKIKLSDLFNDKALLECEENSISFKSDDYNELVPKIEDALAERLEGLDLFKAIYDWSILVGILKGEKYISCAKVQMYEEHQEDLTTLKALLKGKRLYFEIFRKKDVRDNYLSYSDGVKGLTQEDFCKYLKKQLDTVPTLKNRMKSMISFEDVISKEDKLLFRIANNLAFPKQKTKANGVVPVQVHLVELVAILEKAAQYLPFLNVCDANGMSVKDKVKSIMTFRVPYYVGPLAGSKISKEMGRCWCVRSDEKVYPWNFDKVVDVKASAELFIKKMTAKCTYLYGEDVLPKNSIAYCEFMVRNELNSLTVEGQRLSAELLDKIYNDLFIKPVGNSKVTKKVIADYFKQNNIPCKEIGGIDNEIKSQLRSFKDLRRIFGEAEVVKNKVLMEKIILWITLFSDEKNMLRMKLEESYPSLTKEQIKAICRLKYKDWGRLSNTLLNSNAVAYIDETTGEIVTMLAAMRETGCNFMELLSQGNKYDFISRITKFNNGRRNMSDKVTYKDIEDLYVSPKVKRSIWQTVKVIDEIQKVMKKAPSKIFIEMPREDGEKKRTQSRLDRIKELYADCDAYVAELSEKWGADVTELQKQLTRYTEDQLRKDRLYLYFTQLGHCAYSNEIINLSELDNANVYDIDHIYPSSKTKDDSIDNRVLVLRTFNGDKDDRYPLKQEIRSSMQGFWGMLLKRGLISQIKYDRLIRNKALSEEELAGFINRQLVETRQSTKAIKEILEQYCQSTEVVCVKARNVSDFRNEYKFVKFREINDLHHAKDAYLNVVVGNVYDTRFTKNPLVFIRNLKPGDRYTLNTKEIYNREVKRGKYIAWVPGEMGSMAIVKKMMAKNNVLFTRMQIEGKGDLYEDTLKKAPNGQLPLKKNLPTARYGGYNSLRIAYFALVEHEGKKGKLQRSILGIPQIYARKAQVYILDYLIQTYGVKKPRIVISKIKKFSLLELNGFPLHISGRSGKNLLCYAAAQAVISDDVCQYLKNAFNKMERISYWEERLASSEQDVAERAKTNLQYYVKNINSAKDMNLKIYDVLVDKQQNSVYKERPGSQTNTLIENRDKYAVLSIGEQLKILNQILNLLQTGDKKADLTLLGKGSRCGQIQPIADITSKNSAILINQSITGLFEQRIDLLHV